jgi:hypothetical protein
MPYTVHCYDPSVTTPCFIWRGAELVAKSHDIRALRNHLRYHSAERVVVIGRRAAGVPASLSIDFTDGSHCSVEWRNFSVLCRALQFWRKLRGVKLVYRGQEQGLISRDNDFLARNAFDRAQVLQQFR